MTTNNTATQKTTPILQEFTRNQAAEDHLKENPRQTVLLLLQGVVDKGNLAKACHENQAEKRDATLYFQTKYESIHKRPHPLKERACDSLSEMNG